MENFTIDEAEFIQINVQGDPKTRNFKLLKNGLMLKTFNLEKPNKNLLGGFLIGLLKLIFLIQHIVLAKYKIVASDKKSYLTPYKN